ncbi:MAG TPA: M15 family metallopeptidase [Flavobacterium sp.]|jgi:peptidoglycan L-alanyl-D-glutamate endopeptidase CwlK
MDKHTLLRISKLHPSVREEVLTIITVCNASLEGQAKVRITDGFRNLKEQERLYSIGRTASGKKVTNAQAGRSIHNYGFAVDICLIINNKEASWDSKKDWDSDRTADWYECVKIFAYYGWDWGGNWKTFKDIPHFEKRGFTDWRKLSKMKTSSDGYIII